MVYDIKDVGQNIAGAFAGVFTFLLLRSGDPVTIEPNIGFLLGIAWLVALWNPTQRHVREAKYHFLGGLGVTMVVCWYLSVWFGLVDPAVLYTFKYFGSTGWLTVLIALPVAFIFDMTNVQNPLNRYYIRK